MSDPTHQVDAVKTIGQLDWHCGCTKILPKANALRLAGSEIEVF